MKKERIEELLDFAGLHVMVLGDIMLDEYLRGNTTRLSPEAPVPVLNFEERSHKLGGAANVAINLTNLEVQTSLIGVLGNDEAGMHLSRLCGEQDRLASYLIKDESRVTTCKTRVLAKNQHLLRIDHEDTAPVHRELVTKVIAQLASVHTDHPIDIMIFQDYNKGFFSSEMIEGLMKWAKTHEVFTSLDPKTDNIDLFKGIDVFKPNRRELINYLGYEFPLDPNGLLETSKKVLEKLSASWLTLTLSSNGIYIASKVNAHHQPTKATSIIDVSGAGDTVLAISSLLIYQAKASIAEICKISNDAGAIVCNIPGVGIIDKKAIVSKAE